MKKFKLLYIVNFLLFFLLLGCESSSSTNKDICPQCNMPIAKSKEYSSYLGSVYFDDMGCLILWTKKESKDPSKAMVFTKDTKQYIKATDAFYTIKERTPMGYGFTAYEKEQPKSIKFEEMKLRMLRGEHMANPKIRKQILGE